MEDALCAQCDLVLEVPHLHPSGIRRLLRQVRISLSTLRGTPVWVGWWAVAAYARCVKETAAAWRPDIIQIEFHLMGQYLPALLECPAPRILVQHDPGYRAADPMPPEGAGLRRLLGLLDRRSWRRY
jgi:hypothetical protein